MRFYMNVYIGQTRAAGWIRTLESYGFGECCGPGELPPRRHPWFAENRAFSLWQDEVRAAESGSPWSVEEKTARAAKWCDRYEAFLEEIWRLDVQPDFIVVPDMVAAGADSLAVSVAWAPALRRFGRPLYLVVQDGMGPEIASELGPFSGVFVGGSLKWKLKTGRDWVSFAHRHGRKCHIGRVGTEKRVRWALRIGADSIDSALPLWSAENLARFIRGFTPDRNAPLFSREVA